MTNKLLIGVLGNSHSGKTTTWNTLFKHTVRTGKHERILNIRNVDIPVFLINGAPLERKSDLKYILPKYDPDIVLCSFLYHKNVQANFDFFIKKGYQLYIQWLNPGFSDAHDKSLFYNIGIINYLMQNHALVSVCNAKIEPEDRVSNIRNFLLGWYLTHKGAFCGDLESISNSEIDNFESI
jgi:hypothetical protein